MVTTTMNRGLRATLMAGLLVLGAGAAMAAEAHPGAHRAAPGAEAMGPMALPGRMLMGSPERIDRAVDRVLGSVQATDAQRAQVKQIAQAAAVDLRARMEAGQALRAQARTLFTATTIDANAIETLRLQMAQQHDAVSQRMTRAMVDIAQVLTPEQRRTLAERFERRGRGHGHGPEGRGPGGPPPPPPLAVIPPRRAAPAPGWQHPGAPTLLLPMTTRLLLIDDDARLSDMVADYLRGAGHEVATAGSLADGRARLAEALPDALVLDLMLPDGDGLDLCRELRAAPRTRQLPLLMLTARGEPMDRIVGLEMGADDYLPKPFEPRELLARVKALLRRASPAPAGDEVLRFGRLEIDLGERAARLDGRPCDLTSHQFDLLVVMAQSPGRVLSRDQIMDLLKGHPLDAFDRSIDVHISRIRAVIEDDPKHPRRVLTVRGAGYVFAKKQDAETRT